jgi:molecular chaperone GrpE
MNFDPRFQTPGPNGPGAGTEGPETDAERPDGVHAPAPDGAQAPGPERTDADQRGPASPDGADPEQQPAGDEVDAAALQARADKANEYLALAQRTQADFENYRKRAAREAAAATQRGAMKLAKEVLPAVDNLERALAHAPEADDEENAFVSGVKAVHTDLIGALQRAGIERYSPEGEPFDPTLHEAVAQQPFEGFEPGTVVEVFQRGYRIGENVVRPARVVVAG